jgi:AcrR family transcriptional regulator
MGASVRVRSEASVRAVESVERGGRVAAMQRARVLAAAVAAVDELGCARATVVEIARRARVSRRTFYELFADREECLVAVLEDCSRRVAGEIVAAGAGGAAGTKGATGVVGLVWRERVRLGLWAILSFLDREPGLARVCVVHCSRGSQVVIERREAILGELVAVLDEGRGESARGGECPALTAQGLVGAAFSIVHARLSREGGEPLVGLLGELMGMIVLPYLGPGTARREQGRPVPVGRPMLTSVSESGRVHGGAAAAVVVPGGSGDLLEGLPLRLTFRTALVLEAVGERSGISNRLVGERAGIADPGQISKLLSRLQGLGLIVNRGELRGKGGSNAWVLTPAGRGVVQTIPAGSDRTQTRAHVRSRGAVA